MAAVLAGSGDGGSPHPDLRQRREERAFPLHVPLRRERAVPPEAAWASVARGTASAGRRARARKEGRRLEGERS